MCKLIMCLTSESFHSISLLPAQPVCISIEGKPWMSFDKSDECYHLSCQLQPHYSSHMINEVDYGRSTLKTLEHHLGARSYLAGDRVHTKKLTWI